MGKRILVVILAVLLCVTTPFIAYCSQINTPDGVKSSVEGVISYKCASLNVNSVDDMLAKLSENAGDSSSDWYYIALSQYGVDCKNNKSISALKSAVDGFYKKGLSSVKATDLQRVAFALLACKQDITDINGRNLLADATYNRSKYRPLDAQGTNSLAYALLLLDSKGYKTPFEAKDTRDSIINRILDRETNKGGYALSGSTADTDITAIALQALAPYKNRKKVSESIDRCLDILSSRQDESGAYKSFSNTITSETTAQVIIALTSLNIDIASDGRFIKNGNTLLDGLMNFKLDNGAFSHTEGASENNMATYQCLCALVSAYRFFNGEGVFYDFNSKVKTVTKSVNRTVTKSVEKKYNAKSKKSKKISNPETSETINQNSKKENKTISNKQTKKKKLKNKIEKETSKAVQNETTQTVIPKTSEQKSNSENGKPFTPKPFYIDFLLLIIGYLTLFLIKKGGKK